MSCLKEDCTPFPWQSHQKNRSWHHEGCGRDDVDTVIEEFGHWIYISFRPLSYDLYPPFSSTRNILQDAVDEKNLRIAGFVCANMHEEGASRHYWFIEVNNGQVVGVYNSLNGYCQLTVETAKRLQVTGIVLLSASSEGWEAVL